MPTESRLALHSNWSTQVDFLATYQSTGAFVASKSDGLIAHTNGAAETNGSHGVPLPVIETQSTDI